MADIPEIIGYIDSICGDDATGAVCDISRPYKTLDFFYQQQTPADPPRVAFLTAIVLNGDVSMKLDQYFAFRVSNPFRNSNLIIPGREDSTISLLLVTLQINTTVTVPPGGTEVPVIRTGGAFTFEDDHQLNIVEETPDFENGYTPRIIFDHDGEGLPSIVTIRQFESDIILSRPGAIHFGGVVVDIDLADRYEMFTNTNYYLGSAETISVNMIQRNQARIVWRQMRTTAANLSNKNRKGFSNDIVIQQQTFSQCFISQTAANFSTTFGKIAAILTPVTSLITALVCSGRRSASALTILQEKCQKCLEHHNPIVKKKAEEVLTKLQNGEPLTQIQGGTITAEGGENADIVLVRDIPDAQVNNVNLVGNIRPFADTAALDTAEFNLQQQSNSYYNSGSIFRRPSVFTSNYTHTQFDGEVFFVNAANNDITITIPGGIISNNRLFEYKRLDRSNHTVVITSPGGIDGRFQKIELSNKHCKTGYLRLFGFNGGIYLFEE